MKCIFELSFEVQFVAFVSNLKLTIARSSFSQQPLKASADTVADVLVEVDACSLNEVQL